jgi:hypothetical protein
VPTSIAAVPVPRRTGAERSALLFLLVAAVFFWAAKYHPFVSSPRVIDDDARQHVYWTYTFQDTALFRNDLLTDFVASPKVAPPGYQALYFVGARLMDPLLFSQVLSLLLLSACGMLLYYVGREIDAKKGGRLAAFLLLAYFLYSSSGGLPKSFAFPLLLGTVFLVCRNSFAGMAVLLGVQSILYPPVLLNALALAAVSWWRVWRRGTDRRIWWSLIVLGIGAGLAAAALLWVYALWPKAAWGSLVTPGEARTMPEFGPQGRTAFYADTWLQMVLNDRWGIGGVRLAGFVMLIAVMYVLGRRPGFVIPDVARDLVWTSLGLFVLAHLLLFKLHLPSRYVLYTWPLAALLVIAANYDTTRAALDSRWPSLCSFLRRLAERRSLCWTLLGLAACGFVYVQNRYVVNLDPLEVKVDSTAMHLYRYLQTLPKDALIAGHPLEMDNIPLFARRKVLANQELSLPYYRGYYAEVRRRLSDSLVAYYADDAQEIQRFVQQYGVDFILVNRRHFMPEFLSGTIYYEPFNSFVKQRLSAHQRFALLEAAVGQQVYTHGPYILVSFVDMQKGRDGGAADRGEHRHSGL